MGPGLDILGCAITGPADTVEAVLAAAPGIHIIRSGHPELTTDPAGHASGIAASEVLRRAGADGVGVNLSVQKGLPLAGGQGGSAASAVAGACAVNALLGAPLGATDLLAAALEAEA